MGGNEPSELDQGLRMAVVAIVAAVVTASGVISAGRLLASTHSTASAPTALLVSASR